MPLIILEQEQIHVCRGRIFTLLSTCIENIYNLNDDIIFINVFRTCINLNNGPYKKNSGNVPIFSVLNKIFSPTFMIRKI